MEGEWMLPMQQNDKRSFQKVHSNREDSEFFHPNLRIQSGSDVKMKNSPFQYSKTLKRRKTVVNYNRKI